LKNGLGSTRLSAYTAQRALSLFSLFACNSEAYVLAFPLIRLPDGREEDLPGDLPASVFPAPKKEKKGLTRGVEPNIVDEMNTDSLFIILILHKYQWLNQEI
jgi:hypothetical protein